MPLARYRAEYDTTRAATLFEMSAGAEAAIRQALDGFAAIGARLMPASTACGGLTLTSVTRADLPGARAQRQAAPPRVKQDEGAEDQVSAKRTKSAAAPRDAELQERQAAYQSSTAAQPMLAQRTALPAAKCREQLLWALRTHQARVSSPQLLSPHCSTESGSCRW